MKYYLHVAHPFIEDHLRLGWLTCLNHVPHPVTDERAVLMVWLCDCHIPRTPNQDKDRTKPRD